MSNKSDKVLLIGIDGGTFDVIRPMVARGELPVISSLMQNGSWGELESTIPPDTGPAWVSMMTGVNPGKHGVFFFLDKLHNCLNEGRSQGSADIKSPPLWSILSKCDKRIIFLNVPFTYPPVEVNGIMVSGMLIPDSAELLSYPPHIYEELNHKLNGFDINDWDAEVVGANRPNIHNYSDEVIEKISLMTEKRKRAALMLLDENQWDFAMVVFTSVDRLQHLFWKFIDSTDDTLSRNIPQKLREAIFDGYRDVDKAIGEIIKKAGEETTVIISSDHGFGPLRKYFYVNKWLEEIGLLKLKKYLPQKKLVFRVSNLHRICSKIIPAFKPPHIAKKIPFPIIKFSPHTVNELIDWTRTKAYGNQSGGININLRGREPDGIVNSGKEFEEVLNYIRDNFMNLTDGAESGPIADWIFRKEEIYSGPFAGEAADVYYSIKGRSYLQKTNVNVDSRFGNSEVGSGMHRQNGIFMIKGNKCLKSASVKPRMIDIAPTVLYMMGLPVHDDMDGRVLEEVIHPDHFKANPVAHLHFEKHDQSGQEYSSEDEEKIKKGLSGLGYL